jgi:hypothetical protein
LLALLLVFLGRFLVLLLVAVAVELLLLLLLVVAVAAVALRGAAGGGDGFFSSISGALSRSSVGASSFELLRAVAVPVDPLSSSRPSSLTSATDSELAVSTAGAVAASVFVMGDEEAFSSATATSAVLGEVVGTRDDESSPIMVSSFISSSIFIMADSCDTTDNRGNERMKLRNYRLQTRGMDQSM